MFRFEAVKKFLASNSFTNEDGEFLLFPGLLHAAIREAIEEKEYYRAIGILKFEDSQLPRINGMQMGKFVRRENKLRIEQFNEKVGPVLKRKEI